MASPTSVRYQRPASQSRTAWRSAARLPAGIALIIVCLFGMVALPYWSAAKSAELRTELRESLSPLAVSLERLHREVLDSANRVQGYLLTGDAELVRTFEAETASVRADFVRVRELVDTVAPREADLLRLEMEAAQAAYDDWAGHARVSLAFGEMRSDSARRAERSAVGQRRLEQFSDAIGRVGARVRAQEDILRDRLADFQRVEQLLVMVLGTLAGIVVVYLAWLAIALLRAQRLALDERDQLEAVLASVDSGILLLDRESRVAVANERAAELLDVEPARLAGADHRRLVRERIEPRASDPHAYAKRVDFLYDNADAVSEDLVEIARPESLTLSRYSAPVRDDAGESLGRIEVYRDVTEVLRRERELADANERKDRFVAMLSHELRTPLTPILGWIELLREERDPHRIAQGLAAIRRNVELEAQLVEDLLDLSKVVNQKLELDLRPVDVSTAIESAVETVRHLAEDKGVRLETRLPAEPVAAVANETRFIQVVWNLLSNAIKFTPRGKRVTITAERAGERLQVAVEDEGEGIAPDFLPHVFKPFEQGSESRESRQGGLGIGLALARSLVKLHRGEIRAESEGPGLGARFTFWIPLAPAGACAPRRAAAGEGRTARESTRPVEARITRPGGALASVANPAGASGLGLERRPAASEEVPSAVGSPGRRQRVLVVEDNPDTLEAMRILLASWGCNVIAADNAAGALEDVRHQAPDVVISDVGMPHVDGLAFARKVREAMDVDGRIVLIAITGFASGADRKKALDAGFDEYLTKPIDFPALRALLEKAPPPVLEPLQA